MNPKLQKYTVERDRNTKRIAALQTRNAKLEKMIAELESLELHSLLRGANMSYQDLTAYIQAKASQGALPDMEQEEIIDDEDA